MIERHAAIERSLADQQHGPRVIISLGQFAEPEQGVHIGALAHVRQNRNGQFALVECIEQVDGANDLQPVPHA